MSRVLKTLYRSGLEFWLPLPLIAIAFWVVGNAITQQVLTRPYTSVDTLQADTPLGLNLPVTILAINAEIDRQQAKTIVFVRIDEPDVRKMKYEFPVTEVTQIEAAIAQELDIPADTVRRLASYRIKD